LPHRCLVERAGFLIQRSLPRWGLSAVSESLNQVSTWPWFSPNAGKAMVGVNDVGPGGAAYADVLELLKRRWRVRIARNSGRKPRYSNRSRTPPLNPRQNTYYWKEKKAILAIQEARHSIKGGHVASRISRHRRTILESYSYYDVESRMTTRVASAYSARGITFSANHALTRGHNHIQASLSSAKRILPEPYSRAKLPFSALKQAQDGT